MVGGSAHDDVQILCASSPLPGIADSHAIMARIGTAAYGQRLPALVQSARFFAVAGFLGLTFLIGGGSSEDIDSLVVLRPLAVLFSGVGLLGLTAAHWQKAWPLLGMAAVIFALVLVHLVPLPPAWWQALPGRAILAEVDPVAGLGPVWRPLAMVPGAGWASFFALFVPFAVVVNGVQLTSEQRYRLLPVLLGLGLLSGLVSVLQVIGDPLGPLYFYRQTNNGAAVGLFANRNHQAILLACLFPLLPVFAQTARPLGNAARARGLVALGLGAALVPLVLVTGSRAGLILGALGLASCLLLYRGAMPGPAWGRGRSAAPRLMVMLAGAGAALLAALTVLAQRGEALQRLLGTSRLDDRWQMWPHIAAMAWKYFPAGSGIGSFIEVFQIDEPDALLSLSYINHAHNDWLELLLVAGLPGMILLALALVGYVRATISAFRQDAGGAAGRDVVFARLGAVLLALLALGSVGDYPLRTPSLACVFAVAILWLMPAGAGAGAAVAPAEKR